MSSPELVSLSSVAEITQGGRLKLSGNDFVGEGCPAYGAGGLNGYLEVAEFDRPAVVLSSIGARCGKCFFVDGRWTSLANTQLIFPDLSKVDPKYLWYQLNDESSWIRSGTAQPFIKPSNVKARLISLPPIPEQRRIAAILDKADALRAKRREALALIDGLSTSYFEVSFGFSSRGEVEACLAEVTSVITKGTTPTTLGFQFVDTGVPFLRVQNLNGSKVELEGALFISEQTHEALERSRIRPADLLISIAGTIGRAAIVSESMPEMNCNQAVAIIRCEKKIEPIFLLHWLQSKDAQSQIRAGQVTGTISNISLGLLRGLKLRLPPIEKQREFAVSVKKIDVIRQVYATALRQTEALFSSLHQQAFSGKI